MRRLFLLFAALAMASTPVPDAGKTDKDKLQGNWKVVSAIDNGKPVPEGDTKNLKLVIEGDRWTWFGPGQRDTLTGTQKLDPAKMPRTIDIEVTEGAGKGLRLLGIYELDGDNYKVCFSLPKTDPQRPKDFSAKAGTDRLLFVFRRVKE